MSARIYFSKIGPTLTVKLDAELRAAGLAIDGVSYAPQKAGQEVGVDFQATPTAPQLAQAQSLVTAHDATDYEAQATATDSTDFKATLAASLASLDSDEAAIATDITALAAATTLAQVKPIVSNMLQRQARTVVGFRRMLFVLRHLI